MGENMVVDGYEFSDKLECLYYEVLNLLNGKEIRIHITNELIDGNNTIEGTQFYDSSENVIIELRNNSYLETTLSHELLHAYFESIGYPRVFIPFRNDHLYEYGRLISNNVMHKLLLTEQINRGFDIDIFSKELACMLTNNRVKDNVTNFDNISMSMTIIHAFLFSEKYSNIFIQWIKEKIPIAYEMALEQYKFIIESTYNTPFELRRVLIGAYKLFDNIIEMYNLPPLNLHNNIGIDFVFSRRQLLLDFKQVFSIDENILYDQKTNSNIASIISIADQQPIFFLNQDSNYNCKVKSFMQMSVQEFINFSNIRYSIR